MCKISDLYRKKLQRKCVYNIMPLSNIASVVKNGILSYDKTLEIKHKSVALSDVQSIRSNVRVPNGGMLHSYANLYFAYNNPMMYRRKDDAENLCVLAVNFDVFDIDGCVVTDMNAAKSFVRFLNPLKGIDIIDFDRVFQQD